MASDMGFLPIENNKQFTRILELDQRGHGVQSPHFTNGKTEPQRDQWQPSMSHS